MMEKKINLSFETLPSYAATVHHRLKTESIENVMKLQRDNITSYCINENGDTVLHAVLRNKQLTEEHVVSCLRSFLDQGVEPNRQNKHEETALHLAIETRMERAIDLLLEYGDKALDSKDVVYSLFIQLLNTCASWSILDTDYYLRVLRNLMDRGANRCNKVNYEELSKKRIELNDFQRENVELLNFLKEYNVDFIIRSLLDHNPLHCLAKQSHDKSLREELHRRVQEEITRYAYEVYVVDEQGKSALQIAASFGGDQMCEMFFEYGAKIDHRDDSKSTPLHDAVMNNQTKMVTLLLSKGADVNAKDCTGATPLHRAIRNNASLETVKALLANGLDINATNFKGQTALHLAIRCNSLDIVELLCEQHNVNVNAMDCRQLTPLHCAVITRAMGIIELLLHKGADSSAKNFKSETPLHIASKCTSSIMFDILSRLIVRRNTLNCEDAQKQTPLHCAKTLRIFQALLQAGADINCKDIKGNRPIHHLFQIESVDGSKTYDLDTSIPYGIITSLLNAGANFKVRNHEGRSAFYYAQTSLIFIEILKWYPPDPENHQQLKVDFHEWRNRNDDKWIALMKLKASDFPSKEIQELNIDDDGDKEFYEYCLTEVEKLKNIILDNDENSSLLDFLNMPLSRRAEKVSSEELQEKLKELIKSPQFNEQFIAYSPIIQVCYDEAWMRINARPAMRALTEIVLPAEMIEMLLGYLTEEATKNIIEAHKPDGNFVNE